MFYLLAILLGVMTAVLGYFLKNIPNPGQAVSVIAHQDEHEEDEIELTLQKTTSTANSSRTQSPEQKTEQKTDLSRDYKQLYTPTFLAYLGAIGCICWVKDGLLSWSLLFLEAVRGGEDGLDGDTTALLGFALTLGGMGGGVVVNFIATRFFSGHRAKALILFAIVQLISLLLFWHFSIQNVHSVIIAFCFFTTCICMLGMYTVFFFVSPADLPKSVRATGTGVMKLFGYLSSGFSSIYFGSKISSDGSGYDTWIMSLCLATLGVAFFSELARRSRNRAALSHRQDVVTTTNASPPDI